MKKNVVNSILGRTGLRDTSIDVLKTGRIFIYITLVVVTVLYTLSHLEINNLRLKLSNLSEAEGNAELYKKQLDVTSGNYLMYKDNYESLMDKAWNNSDDLIAYITRRYTKVPKEVAVLIADSINFAINTHKMHFSLVVGIMEIESHFNPMVKSKKGAIGLMQIMPSIWGGELCVVEEEDFYDIRTNILCGVKIFLHNLERSDGNIYEALWRYNGTNGKKGEFANLVYAAVGRFEVFRAQINGEYERGEKGVTIID